VNLSNIEIPASFGWPSSSHGMPCSAPFVPL
jgi:hypothetical protein